MVIHLERRPPATCFHFGRLQYPLFYQRIQHRCMTICMRIDIPTKIQITLVWLIFVVGIAGHGSVFAQESADDGFLNFPESARIRVSPAAFSYGDEITVSIYGLPGDFILSPAHVELGPTDISMPGYFGYPGDKPVSNRFLSPSCGRPPRAGSHLSYPAVFNKPARSFTIVRVF